MIKRMMLTSLIALSIASPALADPVDDAVVRYMDVSHIPGVAIAVVDSGRIRDLRAYGLANLEWEGPVTVDTPFQTASASKVFAGVLLMRLAEQKIIDLDEPVTRWIPDAPDSWRDITFRRMASHMSGLPERLGLSASATPQDVVKAAIARPLDYEPASQSRYGFTDFIVMTAALEAATGLSYPDLLKREISDPLGLTNTGFDYATEGRPAKPTALRRRASTYYWDGVRQHEDSFLYPMHGYAAGGLYSSARDLAALFAAIEREGFLTHDSFRQLTTAATLRDGRPGEFAIGWTASIYRGEPVYGHSGGPALADILHVPGRDLTIIALANQRRFFPLLARSIADTQWPAPPRRPAIHDDHPRLTQSVRDVVTQAGNGSLQAEAFSPDGANSKAFLEGFGQALITAVGPVETAEVLATSTADGSTRRTYRLGFEARELIWVVRTDAAGRFLELRPGHDDE